LAKNRPLLPLDLAADLRAVQNVGTATRAMLPSEVERFLGIKTHHSNLTGMNTQNQWSSFNYGCFGYLCIILGRISWVLPSCPFPLLHKYHKGELHKGPNLSNISNDSILPTDFTRNFPSMLKKDHPRNPQDFFVQINPCPACHSQQLQGGGASRKTLLIAPTVFVGFANVWWLDKKSQKNLPQIGVFISFCLKNGDLKSHGIETVKQIAN